MKRGYNDVRMFLEQNFDAEIYEGDWGDPFPKFDWTYIYPEGYFDWIFSWLCPWKIPSNILKNAKKGAINFHPAPPKYPGIGCYNYAIWNEDKNYAVTCHYMDDKFDHGKIISIYCIPLYKNDTIQTLKNRSINKLKTLFYDVIEIILFGGKFIEMEGEEWGEYKSRKDFQEFCELDEYIDWVQNSATEIERKLRATYFKGARDLPYIEVNGKKWCLIPEEDL